MNTLVNYLETENSKILTENGAEAYKSTMDAVLDLFALGGSYRNRSDDECMLLFSRAYDEDPDLALKCLFWLRNTRGGAGERRFFRVCFNWLCIYHVSDAAYLIQFVPEFGRWDDLIYATYETNLFSNAMAFIKKQLALDMSCATPSLLAKWMPSENAASAKTRELYKACREELNWSAREYRKIMSALRARINIVETLMCENRWDEIEFDKIPSKAGFVYRNAFARNDVCGDRYRAFIMQKKPQVNAKTMFPYEIVKNAARCGDDALERKTLDTYWNNLPDYCADSKMSALCVVDTSGSMTCDYGNAKTTPLDIAVSLGLYCGERANGAFKNHFITFSSRPQFISFKSGDIVTKVKDIYNRNLCENTNLEAVFDLLLNTVLSGKAKASDLPNTIIVISDMQIDSATYSWDTSSYRQWNESNAHSLMEKIRLKWRSQGVKMPNLVYWNANSGKDTILDLDPSVRFVSGASPAIFKAVLQNGTMYSIMLGTICTKTYDNICTAPMRGQRASMIY